MYRGIFDSISNLFPPDASNSSLASAVTTKTVSQHCQISPGGHVVLTENQASGRANVQMATEQRELYELKRSLSAKAALSFLTLYNGDSLVKGTVILTSLNQDSFLSQAAFGDASCSF